MADKIIKQKRPKGYPESKINQEKLTLALSSAKIGAWDLDLVHDTAERNLVHDQIFGYKTLQKKWGQKIFGEHIIPEDRGYAQECFEKALETGDFALQCRIIWPNKSIHWIEALGKAHYEKGKPVRIFGTVADITEKKELEKNLENANIAVRNILEDIEVEKEALVNAKLKDEALLQSIGEGVVAVDSDGKIILMNRAAERMLGCNAKECKAEQMIGKPIFEAWRVVDEKGNLVPEEKRPITIAIKGKTTTTTTTTTTTGASYFYTRKDGTAFPVAITVTPVVAENKIIGAIDVFHDMTKEKEQEKLKGDFLALASHQLRTPLSGTKWLIETMQKGITGKIEPKEKEYLEQVYQLNERMIQLVTEMLSALRLESGIEAIKKEKISVADFYQDLIASVASPAKSRWVVFRNSLKNKEIEIESDIQILKTIFDCFVSNAINYSSPGQEVLLDAKEGKDTIILSVKDNGIGIPEKEKSKIFERFYRASNAKAFKPTGSGLGLNIANMLAEKIGAEISFESKQNKGTTFYLHLPKNSNKINQ